MMWKEEYCLGVPVVDEQHRELFRRVENFIVNLNSDVCWENKVMQVNETLEFMKKYVVEHFRDEEEYQKKIRFPGYEAHKHSHEKMTTYVEEFELEYKDSGCSEELIKQFAGRLMSWLIYHIAAEDQEIGVYAMGREVDENE